MAEDPCVVVYRTLVEFADIRGYKLTEKTRLEKYDFQIKLNQEGYYPVHMISDKKCIVVAILSENSKYYKKGADFENLIKTLERSVDKNISIDEVIIITTADIATKKTIMKIVNRFSIAASKNILTKDNYKPLAKYYNLYKYSIFYMNILRHVSVGSNYHVLSSHEKKEIIEYHRKHKMDFPKLLASSSIVPWIGARSGDIVQVTMYSVSACHEIKYLALV
jgi:DNA-directed RNA polymerase subunit H (RpoH/RPB5)